MRALFVLVVTRAHLCQFLPRGLDETTRAHSEYALKLAFAGRHKVLFPGPAMKFVQLHAVHPNILIMSSS